MKTATAAGAVFTGKGEASQFVEIPWARSQIEEKLGFKPYPGTLNISLSKEEANRVRQILKKFRGITIVPPAGFYPATCFRATIMRRTRGAIVLPHTPDYPPNVLEVVAQVNLREALALKDGDMVELTVMLDGNSAA